VENHEGHSVYAGQDLYVIKKVGDHWGWAHKITPNKIDVSGFYDAEPALNYCGTRLIYNNYYKTKEMFGDEEAEVLTHGRLVMSEYTGDSWNLPVEITDTTQFFDTEPNLSENGQLLVYSINTGLALRVSSVPPPQDPEPGEDDNQYHIWEEKTGIAPDKEWKIRFNQRVDSQSVHEQSILVKDAKLKSIPVSVWLDQEGQTVHVRPRDNYNSGDKYYLYITQKIQNLAGDNIAKPIKMTFTIK
jgi:hypothetical protein